MKKIIFILLALIVALIAWFHLTKQFSQQSQVPKPNNGVTQSLPSLEASPPIVVSNTSTLQPINTAATNEPINAFTATNLEQWKASVKDLKPLAGFKYQQHWLVEQPGRRIGIPITLSENGKTIQYSAVLISILAKNETGDIMEVEMQTPNMNINETRELGVQLCAMLGVDSKDFLNWCDKVGNHWLDAPLYAIGNKAYGFQTLMTYNDEKPWMINFVITFR